MLVKTKVFLCLLSIFSMTIFMLNSSSRYSVPPREPDELTNFNTSKKTIRIKVTDFWHDDPTNNNPKCNVYNLLKDEYNILYTENPDFVFYSVFGQQHNKYRGCVKVFFTGENTAPNFNKCDYAISFSPIEFRDRHFRYGGGFSEAIYKAVKARKNESLDRNLTKRKFCNFVYKNNKNLDGVNARNAFFKLLSKYKHIDSPGKVFNNMKNAIEPRYGNWRQGKIDFIKNYKFTIAFENTNTEGYTSEKLPDAFIAHSIPIYYGNSVVGMDYNKKAFIHVNDYNTFEDVVKKVIELDNDDDAYMAMLNEPPLVNATRDPEKELKKFLINIIEKGNKPFNKDPTYFGES